MKVLFIWEVAPELKKHLENALSNAPVELIFPDDTEEATLLKYAPEATVIVGWRPTETLLSAAEKQVLHINPGAGVQHQIERFRNLNTQRKVTLVNGHGNAYYTAQHTVAMLLSLTNQLRPHDQWMREGKWRLGDQEVASIPLRHKMVGLLGYGNINRLVHRMLYGFDLEYVVMKYERDEGLVGRDFIQACYDKDQLETFLHHSDIVIVAAPATKATEGLIGEKELALLGSEGLLINVSRGSVIDEAALYKALKDRWIKAAGIDVWYDYQPEPDADGCLHPFKHPFHKLDNALLSPHRAASPYNSLERWDDVIENIKRATAGRTDFLNVVDLEKEY